MISLARLIRTFNSLAYVPATAENSSKIFMATINRYVYVADVCFSKFKLLKMISLYIIYLFIGRFVLAYVAIVSYQEDAWILCERKCVH